MSEAGPNPGTPHDLIRVGITLAAIAIALAAFRPESRTVYFFLSVGLLAAVGTGYAIAALWGAAGLTKEHMIPGRLPAHLDNRYTALVVLTWAMAFFIVTFLFLMGEARY